jgi:TetR/AcrR family fatty acid metabolism transcriptional regulator
VGRYFDLIGSVLSEGVESGDFWKDLPIKVATKVLFGAMDQMTTSWVLGQRTYKLRDTADAVADVFLSGIGRSK